MFRASRLVLVPSCLMLAAAGTAPRDSRGVRTVLVVQVADGRTNGFIAGAQVRLPKIGRVARTRWDGEVQFDDLDNGKYRIEVRAIGYEPGNVDVALTGDTLPVFFSLDRLSTTLDTVRIRAERTSRYLKEFEERRSHKIGRFFTDSALMDHRAQGLKWMLAMQIPGLMVAGNGVVSGQTSGGCPVYFWLDGFLLTPMPADIGAGGLAGVRQRQVVDLEQLRLEELAGMEVYSRLEAPSQYRPPEQFCKVVLLWSKW